MTYLFNRRMPVALPPLPDHVTDLCAEGTKSARRRSKTVSADGLIAARLKRQIFFRLVGSEGAPHAALMKHSHHEHAIKSQKRDFPKEQDT
jgi:hypothetical protein